MVRPSPTVLPSSVLPVWWLPSLGVLLAGLGALLIGTGMMAMVPPVRPAGAAAMRTGASTTMAVQAAPLAPPQSAGMRGWGEEWSGAGETDPRERWQPRRPSDCLGRDLATGKRAESAHLATVALQGPGECGDLREVLSMMAVAHRADPGTDWCPSCTRRGAAADPRPATGIDLVSAALFGPPDRQPQAAFPADLAIDGRGEVRLYLEQTAAAPWLEPWRRASQAWDEAATGR